MIQNLKINQTKIMNYRNSDLYMETSCLEISTSKKISSQQLGLSVTAPKTVRSLPNSSVSAGSACLADSGAIEIPLRAAIPAWSASGIGIAAKTNPSLSEGTGEEICWNLAGRV